MVPRLTAVLDANVAIGLAKGGVLDLLRHLYSPLYLPVSVRTELTSEGLDRPGSKEIASALGTWIIEVDMDSFIGAQVIVPASAVDLEVLTLATARQVDHILTGDRIVRREARLRGIIALGAAELVALMKTQGLIPHAGPVLQAMRRAGFGISPLDFEAALAAAGEMG